MHAFVPAEGKLLALAVPDGLGCDDVDERAIGAGFGEREAAPVGHKSAEMEWTPPGLPG